MLSQSSGTKHLSDRKAKPRLTPAFFFSACILYLEVIFHLMLFHTAGKELLFISLFAIMAGCIVGGLLGLSGKRASRTISLILLIPLCLLFCVETVYYSVFQTFLVLSGTIGLAGQALDFTDVILKNILARLPLILLLLLPIPLLILFWKKDWLDVPKKPLRRGLLSLAAAAVCYLAVIVPINLEEHTAYSPYDIYYHNVSADMTIEHFGVLTMNRLDVSYMIAGRPTRVLQVTSPAVDPEAPVSGYIEANIAKALEITLSEKDKMEELASTPNTLDIDFDAIAASAPNENVVRLSQYFQSQPGTLKNRYTGMFKGYNVIFITAEGFSGNVIDEKLTPTLYRLKNEGFIFEHYYTPGWYASTSDGEYANLTGLLPTNGIVSMKQTGENKNNMYFTLGRQLERLGYTVNGYHNNSYTYYGRDLSHPNMGYDWHGTGNWFQPELSEYGTEYWPQSDVLLMEQSIPDYIDQEPFHTYYMTVSGHMLYTQTGNQIAYKNHHLVEDLPYSETTKCYLATQLELEKALTLLVDTLEERGLADHTVIVLSGDHVPYNDKPVCDELAGHELESAIEWYQSDLIIWSGSMEEPVKVDKYCYDVDILPTISNLLGLDYDSRLMLGQDILSTAEQLVCFPNRCFISGKCIYNAVTGSITPLTGEEVSQEYLDTMSDIVYNRFAVSELILNEDYYRYLIFK